MEIILLERVEKLGQMGDVVSVKDGFARNFLLPQKKALRATDANRAEFEARRKDIEAQNLENRKEAEGIAAKMEGLKVTLLRQAGDMGQLYGSVTSRDIAGSVTQAGFKMDRGQVILDQPIKELGIHSVRVRLHPEVSAEVGVNVARSEEEAEAQLEGITAAVAEEVFESEELAEAAVEALIETPEEEVEAVEGEDATDGEDAVAEDNAEAAEESEEEKPE